MHVERTVQRPARATSANCGPAARLGHGSAVQARDEHRAGRRRHELHALLLDAQLVGGQRAAQVAGVRTAAGEHGGATAGGGDRVLEVGGETLRVGLVAAQLRQVGELGRGGREDEQRRDCGAEAAARRETVPPAALERRTSATSPAAPAIASSAPPGSE